MRTLAELNDALDAALEMTFPASDPIAVYIPESVGPAQHASNDSSPTEREMARAA